MLERLRKLQETRGQYGNARQLTSVLASDYSLRREVEALSRYFLNRPVSGCGNCHADACTELLTLPIEIAIEIAMKKQESRFELIRGKLLRDARNLDVSLNMTQANITDKLALYHLKTNPGCKKFFIRLPEDWEALVEAYIIPGDETGQPEDKPENPEDAAAQAEAEAALVAEIAAALNAGVSKTKLREQFKTVEKVGERMLTGNLVNELIKRADAITAEGQK
ncbi:MAG: hypothetical protein LBK22_02785 [Tannerella sp.]|jgi:hypothetical protein|nr:hypothetical protein [Tannerella sp.]